MIESTIQLIGGESPWDIVRAYPHITIERVQGGYQIQCRASDGSGWPFARALAQLTAEEQRRFAGDVAAGREPAGTSEMCAARAFVHLVRLVRIATGAEPPAWTRCYDVARARSRHPSARAERGRRPGCGG